MKPCQDKPDFRISSKGWKVIILIVVSEKNMFVTANMDDVTRKYGTESDGKSMPT